MGALCRPSSHVWGVSAPRDCVRAEVSGWPPDKAGKRLFIVLQAFIDESFEQDGVFVLGGYIASANSWATFSREWERLLRPFGTVREDGRYHFKMAEMAMNEERMARVPIFFRVIEDHVLGWVSARIDASALRRAISRIVVPDLEIDWGTYGNPYYITFRCLVDLFHLHRADMADAIPLNEKIDFYFDNRAEKKPILEMWDNYIRARPDAIGHYYGVTPRFEDDTDFLPLQAADFWAWWVRKWCVDGTPEKIQKCDFGTFGLRGEKKFLRVDISFNENELLTNLMQSLRIQIGPDRPIFDERLLK